MYMLPLSAMEYMSCIFLTMSTSVKARKNITCERTNYYLLKIITYESICNDFINLHIFARYNAYV